MKKIFAVTVYWVALLNPKDSLHQIALTISHELGNPTIITTEAVLSEVLNQFSSYGAQWRTIVATESAKLLEEDDVIVIPTDHNLFVQALSLYKSRPDKSYSHVDCISMMVMKNEEITEVLTSDHHFFQEGFTLLF